MGATLTVEQGTAGAAINWEKFSIGKKHYVRFRQPGKNSIALNRVTGGNPSEILGKLSANGQVFLVNPNGIYFGESARVDVSGIVASVHDISDVDFMRGVLDTQAARQRGLFEPAYVARLLAEPETHLTRIQGSKLWHLALLEYWLQRHVDTATQA